MIAGLGSIYLYRMGSRKPTNQVCIHLNSRALNCESLSDQVHNFAGNGSGRFVLYFYVSRGLSLLVCIVAVCAKFLTGQQILASTYSIRLQTLAQAPADPPPARAPLPFGETDQAIPEMSLQRRWILISSLAHRTPIRIFSSLIPCKLCSVLISGFY